jgi:hypothetical protein
MALELPAEVDPLIQSTYETNEFDVAKEFVAQFMEAQAGFAEGTVDWRQFYFPSAVFSYTVDPLIAGFGIAFTGDRNLFRTPTEENSLYRGLAIESVLKDALPPEPPTWMIGEPSFVAPNTVAVIVSGKYECFPIHFVRVLTISSEYETGQLGIISDQLHYLALMDWTKP